MGKAGKPAFLVSSENFDAGECFLRNGPRMQAKALLLVIPAKAGIQWRCTSTSAIARIQHPAQPRHGSAFTGMTSGSSGRLLISICGK
jgi:hypothetical protein